MKTILVVLAACLSLQAAPFLLIDNTTGAARTLILEDMEGAGRLKFVAPPGRYGPVDIAGVLGSGESQFQFALSDTPSVFQTGGSADGMTFWQAHVYIVEPFGSRVSANVVAERCDMEYVLWGVAFGVVCLAFTITLNLIREIRNVNGDIGL